MQWEAGVSGLAAYSDRNVLEIGQFFYNGQTEAASGNFGTSWFIRAIEAVEQ